MNPTRFMAWCMAESVGNADLRSVLSKFEFNSNLEQREGGKER